MKVFRTTSGIVVEHQGKYFQVGDASIDQLLTAADAEAFLLARIEGAQEIALDQQQILAPLQNQEVWAAGVTYLRSRSARIEESKSAGGGDFYDRVYAADRPELFFKSVGGKVVGSGQFVKIRSDSAWSVPEPELTLVINRNAEIIGYSIGNDMSSRDIEGANPLYLPQAKVYDGACAIGPGILLQRTPLSPQTQISMQIWRHEVIEFSGAVRLSEMKRTLQTLTDYLFRHQSFPHGVFLLTGTGVIPPDSFTLHSGDTISISIDALGTLTNTVA